MTEKRFTSQRTDDYNYSDILDNGEWIGICHVDCEDDFVEKLNELNDENKELKIQVKETIFDINVLIDVSAPNTEKIGVLLDLKEKMIETFGEWVILND